jgi:hypothetical protein
VAVGLFGACSSELNNETLTLQSFWHFKHFTVKDQVRSLFSVIISIEVNDALAIVTLPERQEGHTLMSFVYGISTLILCTPPYEAAVLE